MLKTLEEPPAHIKFILATTDPQKVPVTVLSRCLQFNLRQMASSTITTHLQSILQQEQIHFESTALHLIAKAALGSMRDALSLVDQAIAYGNQNVTEHDVRNMLGAVDQSYLLDILQALVAHNSQAMLEIAQQMDERSIGFETALSDLASLLHQVAMAQQSPDSIAQDAPQREQLLQLAQSVSAETLQLYYQIAILGRRDLSLAPDEYAGFSMTMLRMLAFKPESFLDSNLTSKSSKQDSPVIKANITSAKAALQAISGSESSPLTGSTTSADFTATTHQVEVVFDGNWRQLVEKQLKSSALARTLAQNCELIDYTQDAFILCIAESEKHLATANYIDKLSSALQAYFGRKIRLDIEVKAQANSPSKQNALEKAEHQSQAEQAIMADPFVQTLIKEFDASVVPNSIKPLQ